MRTPSRVLGGAGLLALLLLVQCSSSNGLPSTDSPGPTRDGGAGVESDVPVDDDTQALGLEPDEFIGDDVDENTDAIMALDGLRIGSTDVPGETDPDGTPIPLEDETGDLVDASLLEDGALDDPAIVELVTSEAQPEEVPEDPEAVGLASFDPSMALTNDPLPSRPGESASTPTVDRTKNLASTCKRLAGSTVPMRNYGKCVGDDGKFTKTGCCCFGSEFNCVLPNPQPGRNRFLPSWYARYVVNELRRAPADKRRALNEQLTSRHRGPWLLTPQTPIYDGNGKRLSTLSTRLVLINFGQRRTMTTCEGVSGSFVYAFSVRDGNQTKVGWIPASAIRARDDVPNPKMGASVPVDEDAVPPAEAAKGGPNTQSFNMPIARPGAPRTFVAAKFAFRSLSESNAANPASIRSLKVTPGSDSTNEKLSDYLVRSDKTIGLNYNTPRLGGVAADHFFLVDGETLGFERARSTKEKPTILRVRLYKKGATKAERAVYFVFGRVRTRSGGDRFGWVPFRALKAATAIHPPSSACMVGACKDLAPGPRCLEGPMVLECDANGNATPRMCPAGKRCIVTGEGSLGELTGDPPIVPTCVDP